MNCENTVASQTCQKQKEKLIVYWSSDSGNNCICLYLWSNQPNYNNICLNKSAFFYCNNRHCSQQGGRGAENCIGEDNSVLTIQAPLCCWHTRFSCFVLPGYLLQVKEYLVRLLQSSISVSFSKTFVRRHVVLEQNTRVSAAEGSVE